MREETTGRTPSRGGPGCPWCGQLRQPRQPESWSLLGICTVAMVVLSWLALGASGAWVGLAFGVLALVDGLRARRRWRAWVAWRAEHPGPLLPASRGRRFAGACGGPGPQAEQAAQGTARSAEEKIVPRAAD